MLEFDNEEDLQPPPEYLAYMDEFGIHMESEKIASKLEKLNLSASTIAGMEQCPARWSFEKYVKNEILEEDDDTPAERGKLFHDVMEEFFRIEPPESRTKSELSRIIREMLDDKYAKFADNDDVRTWLRDAVMGYFTLGGDPSRVSVADVPTYKDPSQKDKGLEIFVKGKLGDTSREVLGFIDRVIDNPYQESTVIVEDWKGLALDTVLPTPDGQTTMQDVAEGDYVLDLGGEPTQVVGKSEVHHRPCYTVTFSDGSQVVCDNIHLWQFTVYTIDQVFTADDLYALFHTLDEKMYLPATYQHPAFSRYVTGVEQTESVPTQCIKVDSHDSLYLCGEAGVPTHNTGAKSKSYNAKKDSGDGFNEARQQTIYTMLLEQRGIDVSGARLIYPVAGTVVDVDIDNERLREKITETIEQADRSITDSIENNTFEYGPSFLCSWCPLVNVCPQAEKKTFQKAVDARAKQPTAEELKKGIRFA